MPRQLTTLGSASSRIYLGTKSEFTKLQLKHAVVGSDSGEIGKWVEKLEKLPDAISALPDYVAPLNHLEKAFKDFKSKYANKHPKFIQAVESDFLDGPRKVGTKAGDWAKGFSALENQFKSSASFLDKAIKILSVRSLDAELVKSAVEEMSAGGSLFKNAVLQAKSTARHFTVPAVEAMIVKAERLQPLTEAVAKQLRTMPKEQLPAFDTMQVLSALNRVKTGCLEMVGALAAAEK